ncbi:MAG: ATP-dependent RNA helicase HrpA [Moraxella sp.]|nr:ATP-dependent RNA helicase HrpA [Moraxella sp.]
MTESSTSLVMAQDRHRIYKMRQALAKNHDDNLQAKLKTLIERSHAQVMQRKDSIPATLTQSLDNDLPVSHQADTLIDAIKQHQVIIVAGETGSGKTTQLPKLALLAGRGITGQIGHTQPRRLAARSVATRIADELGEKLGQTVSFKVRFSEEGGKHSLIKLMTDGILLAEMAHDRFLSAYDTIIIDEAHERSLNIDFILGYLKRLLPKRPDLKVIITSATLDTERFANYFAKHGKPAPVYVVEGRSYPVEVRYRPLVEEAVGGFDDEAFDEFEEALPRALTSAVAECLEDARQKGHQSASDILIFAATEAQIKELSDILNTYAPAHTEVLPLFARQSYAEQARIFSPSGKGRRIIIATNVAETALTVPNIRYVIDLGFARISRYSYRSRIQRLPIEAISQAAANQRKGRCGRVAAGVCIRLYSKEDFEARPPFTEPEILRTNLASVILQMAYLHLGKVEEFDFITPPDFRLINDGRKLLHELGALGNQPTKTAVKKRQSTEDELTAIGKKMAKMPIDPRLARMLIAGDEFNCLADMLTIVSALAVQDIRERPSDKQAQADQKHALFKQDKSDFLFYLEMFAVLFDAHQMHEGEKLSANARKNFAKKHYLSFPRIREWQKTHEQLTHMMAELGFLIDKNIRYVNAPKEEDIKPSPTEKKRLSLKELKTTKPKIESKKDTITTTKLAHYANIHRALLTALLSFVAHKSEVKGEYLMTKNQKARIFPASSLHKKGEEWLMAFEVVETSQIYMRTVAKIEPEWIIAAAGGLLKYHYFEPHWSKKTGRVRAYAQMSLFGLTIINKQLVNYEQVDLNQSREIFIQDALVLNDYGYAMPFLTHNVKKISEVELIEEKLRRRDLLVEEEVLYQFYAKRIPKHIASRKAFEDFYYEQSKTDAEFLYFKDEDIINEDAKAGKEFPEYWQLGALKLPLSYVFDPSSDKDGVSVKVPIKALSQLDAVALLWGIAGWRYELVTQLLKGLPKEARRHIVPIPDTVAKIFDKLNPNKDDGLLTQLSQLLLGFGVKITPSEFNLNAVDDYLQPLICVVDDKGKMIDSSRNLRQLQQKYQTDNSAVLTIQTGIHKTFPKHFHFVQNKHISGVSIQEFCALSPDNATHAVSILHYTNFSSALFMHKRGVLSLIKLTLGAKQKQLTSQIDKAFRLAFAPLGDLEKLTQLVIDASLQSAFDLYAPSLTCEDLIHFNAYEQKVRLQLTGLGEDNERLLLDKLPLSAQEFDLTAQAVSDKFLLVGQTMLKTLKEIYTLWQVIRGQLLMLDTEVFQDNIADIEDQLDDLNLGEFIYQVDSAIWINYPRYLTALKVRLDRLPNNIQADSEAVYQLDTHMERLSGRAHEPKLAQYRWALEEYRINLFAQPMKTLYPISDKRLEKLWAKLTTM